MSIRGSRHGAAHRAQNRASAGLGWLILLTVQSGVTTMRGPSACSVHLSLSHTKAIGGTFRRYPYNGPAIVDASATLPFLNPPCIAPLVDGGLVNPLTIKHLSCDLIQASPIPPQRQREVYMEGLTRYACFEHERRLLGVCGPPCAKCHEWCVCHI